ncbi:TorF family putative porin [Erythrobacter sp. T5W1-R]|uniref:TorF family putative porin n=1 Tax=Erythrobacter sp. T5W1-R TaxID=3101752 RepID=UPI002AFF6681|nr:TorF family putative porin [Erythrobacter sp. T5W1-R]MEA1618243.1 TorF family putative porin [Erythrobacter sp. T5W1-R]
MSSVLLLASAVIATAPQPAPVPSAPRAATVAAPHQDAPCADSCPADPAIAASAPAIAPVDPAQASHLASFGGFELSANAALATQYRYRGTNLSGERIAVQAGLDLDHSSGFYAGLWGSQINNSTTGYGNVELDIYAGYTFPLIEGVTADVGIIAYTFPDAPVGNLNFVELYSSLTATLGPASAKLGVAWDPGTNGFAFGGFVRDNLYVQGDVSVGIPRTALTLKGHLGYTDGTRRFATNNGAFDWSIGASYTVFGPITASLEYVDNEADVLFAPTNPNSANVVGKISVNF